MLKKDNDISLDSNKCGRFLLKLLIVTVRSAAFNTKLNIQGSIFSTKIFKFNFCFIEKATQKNSLFIIYSTGNEKGEQPKFSFRINV